MDIALQFIGANGNSIDLINNDYFYLNGADGLTSFSSSISSSTLPNMDGDTVNSIQANSRPITLYFEIKYGIDVEEAKEFIFRTVKPKLVGTLRMTRNGRTTEIKGIAEAAEMPRFSNKVLMQISLYCSNPYWEDMEYIAVELARVIDGHYFPVDVGGLAFPAEGIPFGTYDLNMTQTYTNEGHTACGMVITIIALATVTNPILYKSDGSFIGINDTLQTGDEIVINTNRGSKEILKNGVSIFNKIRRGSVFLQLETGDNEFTIDSDEGTEGNMYFTLTFKRRFV